MFTAAEFRDAGDVSSCCQRPSGDHGTAAARVSLGRRSELAAGCIQLLA
jgi:hypothetical protein